MLDSQRESLTIYATEPTRSLLKVGAAAISESDCALSTEEDGTHTVADFLLDYFEAANLSEEHATLNHECGGRGKGMCSMSYGLHLGDKTDTNILLFSLDDNGRIRGDEFVCISQ